MQENIALRVTTSPIERAVKMVWGVAATLLCVLYTAVLSCMAAAIAPFSQNMLKALARFWARLIMLTCGARVEFQGLKNLEGVRACVLVGNHESYFDIFALLAYLPREIRFMAKKEWLKLPVFGFALKYSRHIVVDREHGQSIRKALTADGGEYCICIFGEGHRYNDGKIHEFKDGAAWLAIQAQMPCVPVASYGGSALFPRGVKFVNPGGKMRVSLGQPIPTEGLKSRDRKELTQKLESAVRAMYEASARARS